MTPTLNLMQAAQRALQERRSDARNPSEVIFVSERFLRDWLNEKTSAIQPTHLREMIETLWAGGTVNMRGIPIYMDPWLKFGFVVLKGTEASNTMKHIHKRNESRRLAKWTRKNPLSSATAGTTGTSYGDVGMQNSQRS